MRFLLRDSANKKPMRVHQAFVRLISVSTSTNDKRGHEIFFVAEPDAAHVYKFDMVILHYTLFWFLSAHNFLRSLQN